MGMKQAQNRLQALLAERSLNAQNSAVYLHDCAVSDIRIIDYPGEPQHAAKAERTSQFYGASLSLSL